MPGKKVRKPTRKLSRKIKISSGRRITKLSKLSKDKGASPPLTEAQVRSRLRPRAARKSATNLSVGFDLMVASPTSPKVTHQAKVERSAQALRAKAPFLKGAKRVKGMGVQVRIKATELGTRVFRPSIRGALVPLPRETSATRATDKAGGGPQFDGFLPAHLPFNPIPPQLDRALRVRKYLGELPKRTQKNRYALTTIFSPDNRYTFSDTSFPWCTIGRVDTGGGLASGVLIGPRHLLTVSHAMVWGSNNTVGWVRFRPSYFDGNAPFGEAWATRWYAYKKVYGPTINRSEGRQDYVVLVLDRRMGDVCGWMGSRTYSDSWDGSRYWRHIGYPGDMAAGQRPSYERDIALDGSFWDISSHQRIFHRGDVWPGQSGGPFFAWWNGESWPRVVSVQSAQNSSENTASGGSRMVKLIQRARNEFP